MNNRPGVAFVTTEKMEVYTRKIEYAGPRPVGITKTTKGYDTSNEVDNHVKNISIRRDRKVRTASKEEV